MAMTTVVVSAAGVPTVTTSLARWSELVSETAFTTWAKATGYMAATRAAVATLASPRTWDALATWAALSTQATQIMRAPPPVWASRAMTAAPWVARTTRAVLRTWAANAA
ncbi:hypothetical protein JG687_00017590 [Phytophthora cactorum]|uniref:Uncharacterized protein n=1 Tax=Phytophthora cactorum TaxID=29920 RepID=A0A329S7B7_9STRA|nr:hypothetical protein Pcac1_g23821 [Phytophthora cactorum]KAG2823322.1 hypothetical protein PC111_g10271 [Phytophthora cactorum]KAG2848429.1 hypothetical protein PC112_g688 [Phytophthora cactorum]KAG2868649.1 hypothetical protein PC113_g877 [Phytophthora cactorum]KAG2926746.1 hypothetical protein PC114_g3717 [Phytophthora cactorum]